MDMAEVITVSAQTYIVLQLRRLDHIYTCIGKIHYCGPVHACDCYTITVNKWVRKQKVCIHDLDMSQKSELKLYNSTNQYLFTQYNWWEGVNISHLYIAVIARTTAHTSNYSIYEEEVILSKIWHIINKSYREERKKKKIYIYIP